MKTTPIIPILLVLATGFSSATAQFEEWQHSGSMYILTTPDGADLAEGSRVKDFPLLVRLNADHFPFAKAKKDGSDLRFSMNGKALPFEIERWDSKAGSASIWIRIPEILGNSQQELRLHWGNAKAGNVSDGKTVFNESNGYVGVWHMANKVEDATGNLDSKDTGTEPKAGQIGGGRYFPGNKGIFLGTEIQSLPAGSAPHSTQLWFRSEVANATMLGWGVEKGQGKVHVKYASPSTVRFDCYFSNGNARAPIPGRSKGWTHAFHTYENGQSALYINGEKLDEGNPQATPMNIPQPARMWIGGWYNRYSYVGDLDEVRVSNVARPEDWIRLEYENQKAGQTLVGHLVQEGEDPSVAIQQLEINESAVAKLSVQPGNSRKIYWREIRDGQETLLATDRFSIHYNPGRVSGDQLYRIWMDAVYERGVRSIEIPVYVREALPDPEFTLCAPKTWDGRSEIIVKPTILNQAALEKAGLPELEYRWEVSGLATLSRKEHGQLVLERSQASGKLTVGLSLSNGGETISQSVDISVQTKGDAPFVPYQPAGQELPMDGQFYARDASNKGTLHCQGKLPSPAGEVFLRVYKDGQVFARDSQAPGKGQSYAFEVKLDSGLVKYRVELGTKTNGKETIFHRAGDILCGDAYLINGQSNALATDTREVSPKVTNEWVRSYGRSQFFKEGEKENLWCQPVWKAGREYMAELGWWGMDLANRLVESEKVPVFILNAARGGTRIDQHQRNDANPTDPGTIYGRMLWRIQQARLTHGIKAIIWHQGENDQGAAGPDGGYGWETYQDYFVEMSADWRRDFPNFKKIYLFQIWPNACAMGGKEGNGDMLRERQRTLPFLYDNMTILSSLGVRPPGGCHYPLEGWSQFADMLHPLLLKEIHGKAQKPDLSAPNLLKATATSPGTLILEFNQDIVWHDKLTSQFYLNDKEGLIQEGKGKDGSQLVLKFDPNIQPLHITYLRERSWNQDNLLLGKNGIAALTFCKVRVFSWQ